MSRESEITSIAEAMSKAAQMLLKAEGDRTLFTDPSRKYYVDIGNQRFFYFNPSTGEPTPFTNSIRLAHIAAVEELIFNFKARIEGLRCKLVQLGKATS